MSTRRFFSPDYATAQKRFRDAVAAAAGELTSLALPVTGPAREELAIDVAWFGAAAPRRALVHTSGVHGVEGYAGSAIQLQWLADGVPDLPADAAVALVHFVNPYGAAWLRRVNENNVDLNRNFGAGGVQSGGAEEYAALDALLNPRSPPRGDFFYARAAMLVLRQGMNRLRTAIIGGQTMNPRGLFYAGQKLEAGPATYQNYLAPRLAAAARIVAVDVHTGFGRYGEDTLMLHAAANRAHLNQRMQEAFGARAQLTDGSGDAYHVEGSHEEMYARLVPRADVHFVTQEFGTLHAVRVLAALRAENRWHHHGTGVIEHRSKRRLLSAFCPEDEAWRAKVLSRGREVIGQACALAFE